jgi:hypothetical protein
MYCKPLYHLRINKTHYVYVQDKLGIYLLSTSTTLAISIGFVKKKLRKLHFFYFLNLATKGILG